MRTQNEPSSNPTNEGTKNDEASVGQSIRITIKGVPNQNMTAKTYTTAVKRNDLSIQRCNFTSSGNSLALDAREVFRRRTLNKAVLRLAVPMIINGVADRPYSNTSKDRSMAMFLTLLSSHIRPVRTHYLKNSPSKGLQQ